MENQIFIDWMAHYPWILFLAIAILPGLGVPNTPMLILCGTSMTAAFGVKEAILLAVAAVITNILWTWWVAAYPFRDFLHQRVSPMVKKYVKGQRELNERSVLMITFLLHITPGVPLFIQNYFPGLNRLAYWKYLAIAVPIQAAYTALIVGTSGQIFVALKAYPLAVLTAGLLIWGIIVFQRRKRTKSPAI